MSGARVIVEAGFRDFRVTPSQGSHFFQNLTAFQVGYFTANPDAGEGFVDWEWLGDADASGGAGLCKASAVRDGIRGGDEWASECGSSGEAGDGQISERRLEGDTRHLDVFQTDCPFDSWDARFLDSRQRDPEAGSQKHRGRSLGMTEPREGRDTSLRSV